MKPTLNLFVFADALGWELVSRTGFLEDLLPVRNSCETVFGYSSACDPTILTGLMPDEHGHFSCFIRAQQLSPFRNLGKWSCLPKKVAEYHRVRHHLSRLVAKQHDYTGYFQLYSVPFACLPWLDYTEKHDIYEPGGILGGQETIFQDWQRSGKPWLRSDWRRSDAENLAEARQAIEKGEIELAYLFTGRLDAVMHQHGTHGPEVEACLESYERDLRSLLDSAAGRYRDVRLSIFGDHGMADTVTCSDLMRRWNQLGFRYGTDYVAVWDATMVRFWFENEIVREEALAWLREQDDGSLVGDAQLREWGCFFPNRIYGDAIYLLPSGSLFTPSFMNRSRVPGMHGYAPEHPDSAAAWLSNTDALPAPKHLKEIFSAMQQAAVPAVQEASASAAPSKVLLDRKTVQLNSG